MVKRFPMQSFLYLVFAIIIMMVSWEHNRALAAVVDSDIPEESIRLRILANSDSVADQALKRQVRDAIVKEMNGWVAGPTSLEQAREVVSAHLPELDSVVGQVIANNGYSYGYTVELGTVPFPAKMYGNKVYPAGDYEAVRVVIGGGEGQNWWCVLFPPLCFVSSDSGEAVAADSKSEQSKPAEASKSKASGKVEKSAKAAKETGKTEGKASASVKADSADKPVLAKVSNDTDEDGKGAPRKVKFYLWEKLKTLFA